MLNGIFTIVAKNYLPRARTLGDSIKELHPDIDFYIILADEFETEEKNIKIPYSVIESKDLQIPNFEVMAFKYNILEFSTGIKPFCFSFLFKKYGYTNIIYFDPDIYVFNPLTPIFEDLNTHSVVLTPHILTMEERYTGIVSEEELLFVGMYNLGFVAFRGDSLTEKILLWWQNRLFYKGYADKEDALHVDQKWMDFLQCFYPEQVKISRKLGYNMAVWNIHEREIFFQEGTYYVGDRGKSKLGEELIFFHFAGFDPKNTVSVHKGHPLSLFTKFPDVISIFDIYRNHLLANHFNDYLKLAYKYARYENGVAIVDFQRRLYRTIKNNMSLYPDPFLCNENSYYKLLENKGLIFKPKIVSGIGEVNSRATHNVPSIIKKLEIGLKLFIKIVGVKNYILLLKVFREFYKFERHYFLIKK